MFAMRESWRKGLSGAVSAIVIAVVLVAGLASASYINLTTARYNEAQMQEALRQARLGSELIRIHIHSMDGAVDSPPRITFVNAWGYESRIIQLVIIGRETSGGGEGGGGGNNGGGGRRCHIVDGILECEIGEDGNTGGSTDGYTRTTMGDGQSQTQIIATIDLRNRPIVLPPGARLTIDPAQIGLSYPTFKRMADQIRSIHAYTEAGNSFGSTWGFPREDNLAGRTVATTYNATTSEIWYVPAFTQMNKNFTVGRYMTIGDIPDTDLVKVFARNHFEKARVDVGAHLGTWVCGSYHQTYTWICTGYIWAGPSVRVTSAGLGYPPAPEPRVEASGGNCYGRCWWAYSNWVQVGGVTVYGKEFTDLDWTQWRWYPQDGWVSYEGPFMHHEVEESIYGYNGPERVIIQISGDDGSCTITYMLGRTTITPSQPGFRPTESTYTRTYYPTRPYPDNPVRQTLLLSVAKVFRLNAEQTPLSSPTTQIYTTHVAGTTTYSTATILTSSWVETTTTACYQGNCYQSPSWFLTTWTRTTTISWLIPLTLTQTTVRTALPADTIIDRYYYVADVQCSASYPPEPPEIVRRGGTNEPPPPYVPKPVGPEYCTVIEDQVTVPVTREVIVGVKADGSPIIYIVTDYEVRLEPRRICPR